MNDLFAAQEGVDYQGNRARAIYNEANPVKVLCVAIGAGLGYMDDFGPSKAENQAAAKSLIEAQGGTYSGQSLAEAIALDSGFKRETPAPVFTVDAAGNRVPMDRGTTPNWTCNNIMGTAQDATEFALGTLEAPVVHSWTCGAYSFCSHLMQDYQMN